MSPGSRTSGIIALVRIDAASKPLAEGMGDVPTPTSMVEERAVQKTRTPKDRPWRRQVADFQEDTSRIWTARRRNGKSQYRLIES
jgi:hypothetical protein